VATGNYPGRARSADELRADMDKAGSLIPGAKRLNLHAMYADAPEVPDRTEITADHFRPWIDWAKGKSFGLDFNPTCFSHPMAESGFTLSSPDPAVRRFWIEHCVASSRLLSAG